MTVDADGLIVGNSDQCTCANLSTTLNGPLSQRYKRQTGEVFISRSNSQRVFRARLGGRRLARDRQQLTRKRGNYRRIKQQFQDYTDSFQEEDFDII